jgi:hypothetical protein
MTLVYHNVDATFSFFCQIDVRRKKNAIWVTINNKMKFDKSIFSNSSPVNGL